ncbi:hypothetical protein BU16DRAFT_543023 [Lophium mytilinum]|uniref:Uncharacterized protein n=1 Tax=Lophium mytilinum TaxID=390894 RepID=A0A6A6QFB6_9PEZI|nr:hypothetical protein BU16DRAFT_543023 [Lophium mytilinum]
MLKRDPWTRTGSGGGTSEKARLCLTAFSPPVRTPEHHPAPPTAVQFRCMEAGRLLVPVAERAASLNTSSARPQDENARHGLPSRAPAPGCVTVVEGYLGTAVSLIKAGESAIKLQAATDAMERAAGEHALESRRAIGDVAVSRTEVGKRGADVDSTTVLLRRINNVIQG